MKNTYECMLLLDNREVKQGWEPLKEQVTGKFQKYGAEIVSARRWDERRLAYPIKGQSRGTYLLIYYTSETGANAGIRRELELSEPVLRHMITACEEIPAEAHEPEAEFDVNAIPVGDEEPEAQEAAGDESDKESDDEKAKKDQKAKKDDKAKDDDKAEDDKDGDEKTEKAEAAGGASESSSEPEKVEETK